MLRPGDRVLLSGPYGSFTAAPGEPGPVLFLAGGSGLAPVRALAEANTLGTARVSRSFCSSPPARSGT